MGAVNPYIIVVTGKMGVGKTYLTAKQIKSYAKKHPNRCVLIFDVNNEKDYRKFKTVDFNIEEVQRAKEIERKSGKRVYTQSEKNIAQLKGGIRRVTKFTKSKMPMNMVQKQLTMRTLALNFTNGLLLFDDINDYYDNFESTEVKGLFKTIRHRGQDWIIHMQSLNPMRRIHFEATSVIRMHFDGFDVDLIRSKAPGYYEILKICQFIVDHEYRRNNNPYFHLYAWVKDLKIKGCTEEQFERACKAYLNLNQNDTDLRRFQAEVANQNGRHKPNHPDRMKAEQVWIKDRIEIYLK